MKGSLNRLTAWCAQCGPLDRVDEDGCCLNCGGDAMGPGADQTCAALRSQEGKKQYMDDMSEDWLINYFRLRQRLPKEIGTHCLAHHNPEPYVVIGSNFWDMIKPDQWTEAEKLVIECGEKLLALVKKP